jgi:hypothetical protein
MSIEVKADGPRLDRVIVTLSSGSDKSHEHRLFPSDEPPTLLIRVTIANTASPLL